MTSPDELHKLWRSSQRWTRIMGVAIGGSVALTAAGSAVFSVTPPHGGPLHDLSAWAMGWGIVFIFASVIAFIALLTYRADLRKQGAE